MALAALSLPGELQRFINRALRGELELRVRNLEDNARLLYYGGQQILWGMLTAAAAGAGGAVRRARPAARGLGGRDRRGRCSGCSWCSPGWRAGPRRSRGRRRLTLARLRGISKPGHMRPILVNIPAKPLFVVLLARRRGVGRATSLRRRKDPKLRVGSTPLYLLGGAAVPLYMKTGSLCRASRRSRTLAPSPIYAYGVMLGTSLVVGWFMAMQLAKQDGIDQQEAGSIYMWTAVWSIIGSRLLYVITNAVRVRQHHARS